MASEQGKTSSCSRLVKNCCASGDNPQVSLDEYRRKRNPRKTPEPFGAAEGNGERPRFVIQRHAARRLHYDFRLERDGALASWAVPKGVPLRRGERHLAVHVEDHPLEYADFEGVIPAGEYGAGTVEIWDRGTYDLLEEKRNGGLTVRLRGERLDGVWTLVPASLDGDPKNWLLLRKDAGDGAGGRYEPMRAIAADALPVGEGWVFEPKWDGYRAIVTVSGGEVTLTSRNGNDLTERFREVARAATLAITTPDAVLDGEICALDDQGRSRFSLLQEGGGIPVLVLFDLLELDVASRSSTCRSSERRERLEQTRRLERRRARLAAVRRRRSAPRRGASAGPRGRRRQEGGLAVQAGPPIAGLAQAQAAPDAGGRHRRVHARPGAARRAGSARSSRGYTTRVCCAGRETSERASRTERSSGCRALLAPLERPDSPFAEVPKMPRVRRSDVVVGRAEARRRGRVRRVDARGPAARPLVPAPA